MNELIKMGNEIEMTSLELVDLINKFRLEEGYDTQKRHDNLIRDIDNEIKTLENVGISTYLNFELSSYTDGTRNYRCYKLNKSGVMQMLNKESAAVRFKTQQYIEILENKLTLVNQQHMITNLIGRDKEQEKFIGDLKEAITEQQDQINYLNSKIGVRRKEVYNYSSHIKDYLGIDIVDKDYKAIKRIFLYELDADKFEDIIYDRNNIIILNEICEQYKPSEQINIF